jgi:hypothetical protein
MRKTALLLAYAAIVAAPAAAQSERYLDLMVVKVKPERLADFDAIARKFADANRNNDGDHWIAIETMYGEQDTVTFVSPRADLGAIETGMGQFVRALTKALGPAGTGKLHQDFHQTMAESRGELRIRRWDLSSNVPEDPAARLKMIGESRYIGTTAIHVRPGRAPEYEAQLKAIKKAAESAEGGTPFLVSQSLAGDTGQAYYISVVSKSFGDFEKITPLRKVLGEDGFEKYLRTVSEVATEVRSTVGRFAPEMSSVPAAISQAAPEFWTPKPPAAKPKPAKQ